MKRILLFFAFVFIFKCEIFSQYSDTAELRSDINNWIKPNANLTGTQLNKLLRGFLQFTKPNAATTQNLRDTSAEMRSLAAAFDTTLLGYLLKIDTVNGKQQFSVDSIALADLLATIGGSGTSWQLNGNAGLNFSTNFIGTTDAVNIKFKRNNVFAGMIASNENTSLGVLSNSSTSHFDNTAIGHGALQNSATDGSTAVGALALNSATTGSNTAVGYIAGQGITTGTENTIIGREAASRNITGSNNLFVGHYSDFAGSSTSISNSIAIGNSAKVGCNNCAVIGDSALTINTGFGRSYPAATVDIKGSLKFVDGNQSLGKVLTTDANGNATWQIPSGGGSVISVKKIAIGIFGQSLAGVYDSTIGTWVKPPLRNNIKAFKFGSYATANVDLDNIVTGFGSHWPRNNLALQIAQNYINDNPNDSAFLYNYATGATGSWLYTPKTTGPGEITSSNSMLNGIIGYLDSVPVADKLDLVIIQHGENDMISKNGVFWLRNIIEFVDTLIKHRAVKDSALFIINYPGNDVSNDSLRLSIDSLYYTDFKQTIIGNRNITVCRHLLPTQDGFHPDNEAYDELGKMDYSIWKKGYHDNVRRPDSSYNYFKLLYSNTTLGTTRKVAIGSTTSDPSVGYQFKVYQPAATNTNFMSLRSTSSGAVGNQQTLNFDLANFSTGGSALNHYSENGSAAVVYRNRIVMADTNTYFQNTTSSTVASFGDNANIFNVPSQFTSPVLTSAGFRSNALSIIATTASSSPQLIIASTAAAQGLAAEFQFSIGGTIANNGQPAASIQGFHNGAGGGALALNYFPGFSTRTLGIWLNNNGNVSIGNNQAPTALLDIMPGNTTRAQIRLRGSVAPTSPNKGDIYFDSTSTGNNNAIIYDGTNSCRLFKGLSGSATLDFSSISAQTGSELTITVTGAADGDDVLVSPPNASFNAGVVYKARVSSSNTVSVTAYNITTGSIDPASGTFKVTVIKL